MAGILRLRLSKEERLILERRAKRAGMKEAAFVRKLICDDEIVTDADLARWADSRAGEETLRIRPRS